MGSLRADSSGASSLQNSKSSTPSLPPTNDDIEAVIQMATSSRSGPDGRGGGPLRDTRTQLFVGNLPYRVRWQDLKDLFRKAGTVLRADVSLGPDNRSRGYGTVLLASAEDAGRAVDMFNGYSWQTRVLEVRPDRIPPDFENPLGIAPMAGFPSGLSNTPSLPGASYGPPGQNHPLITSMPPSSMPDDFDYSSFYMHEALDPSSNGGRNLFVGNLPFHCQWQDLKDLFRQAGTIIRADVALGQDGRSRGFGTVVFASDVDADRAVKMFNGHDYNGRQLKVHYDKFSQTSQPTTGSTSPTLTTSYPQSLNHNNHPFGSQMMNPPNHISMPMGYPFDMGAMSGPSSPYGAPPNGGMAQPHHSHAHSISVDRLSASLASANLGGRESAASSDIHSGSSSSSRSQHQQGHSQNHNHSQQNYNQQTYNHQHARQQQQQQQQQQHGSNHHHAHPGPISLPPPPSAHGFPMPLPHNLSPHASSPLHHPMSPMYHHHSMMTPHGLPPITPSMPSFSFLPQPSPHAPASPGHHPMQHSYASSNNPAMHAAHVLSTLSPGVTMSPGAFWGHPGGGANPFINPAVGAPVHGSPGGFFGMNMHPVSPAATAGGEEPTGYFPHIPAEGGYFPPMPSSRLANEIMRDKASPEEVRTPGSTSSGVTDMGTGTPRDSERRTSSSTTGTSWHTPDEAFMDAQAQATRDAADKEASSSFLPDDENENDSGAHDGKGNDLLGVDGAHSIVRTNSMSVSGKTADRMPMIRGGSDPVQTHSVKDEGRSSAGAGERRWGTGDNALPGLGLGIAVRSK